MKLLELSRMNMGNTKDKIISIYIKIKMVIYLQIITIF